MLSSLNALTDLAFLHIAGADVRHIRLRLGVSFGVVLIDDKIKGSRLVGDLWWSISGLRRAAEVATVPPLCCIP